VSTNAQRGKATRERLIGAATELFAAQGFDGTSTDAVLQASGVSRGSLYHHFASKEALFVAVVEDLLVRVGEEMAAAQAGATDPVAVLRAGSLDWLQRAGDPVIGRIVVIDGPAVLGWKTFREIDEQNSLGLIRYALALAADGGRLPVAHVDAFAHIILAAVNELATMIATADDRDHALRDGQAAMTEFFDRLFAPKGPA
jgi:AcrR family transcriptional regulator